MNGIFSGLFAILRLPFDALKYILGLIFKSIRTLIVCLTLILIVPLALYGTYAIFDYNKNAYRFRSTDKCAIKDKIFPGVVPDFSYRCVDASTYKSETYSSYVFFMASERDPLPGQSGHGWMALVQLRNDPEKLLLTRYSVFGFWGNGVYSCGPTLSTIYGFFRPIIPSSIGELLESNYRAFCMGGVSGPEGPDIAYNAAGIPFEPVKSLDQVHKLLNNTSRTQTLFAVAIDPEQFNEISFRAGEFSVLKYRLMAHDCTSLLYSMASAIGLYTPPRLLFPFPSQSVNAIARMNVAPGGL